jgi:hypothetical protein
MIILSLHLSKGPEIDSYLYHCGYRESVLRYLSIVADYANSEIMQQIAQATVCTAQWLGWVRLFVIDF